MDDSTPISAADAPAPFLEAAPPHWVGRGLASLLIALFVAAAVACLVIRVPETVSSPFQLVPVRGTDPVRAARGGLVIKVGVQDTEPVQQGQTLFVIQSASVGDRSSELATLGAQLGGAREKIENARRQYESQRLGDQAEMEKLKGRVRELEKIITLKRQQQALTNELLGRYEKLRDKGFSSRAEAISHELEASRITAELRQSELDRAEAANAIEKLGHEMTRRAAEHTELERRESEEGAKAEIRVATLRAERGTSGRSDLELVAPCSGVVLRSRVNGPGAVVTEGAIVCELACSGEALQAELQVPPSGAGRLRTGQVVKLLYEAFPYQRYGVRYGKVRWVSPAATREAERPAATGEPERPTFRAFVDLDDDGILVDGERRPLRAGMGGSARIVLGKRSLFSYALGPIRQLRESLATGPEASSSR
jgi:membrane fusion protein